MHCHRVYSSRYSSNACSINLMNIAVSRLCGLCSINSSYSVVSHGLLSCVTLLREAQLFPTDTPDILSVEILAYCCMNKGNRSFVCPRSTFINCCILFHYLHSFVHASFNYHPAMPLVSSTCLVPLTLLMSTGP